MGVKKLHSENYKHQGKKEITQINGKMHNAGRLQELMSTHTCATVTRYW